MGKYDLNCFVYQTKEFVGWGSSAGMQVRIKVKQFELFSLVYHLHLNQLILSGSAFFFSFSFTGDSNKLTDMQVRRENSLNQLVRYTICIWISLIYHLNQHLICFGFSLRKIMISSADMQVRRKAESKQTKQFELSS